MSEAVEKLRAARALVARPNGWTRGAMARSFDGTEVEVTNRLATAFDPLGALNRVGVDSAAIGFFRKAIGTPGITNWNDAGGRTQADVVAAFDRAIALAEAEARHA